MSGLLGLRLSERANWISVPRSVGGRKQAPTADVCGRCTSAATSGKCRETLLIDSSEYYSPCFFFFLLGKKNNFPLRLLLWCTPKIFPTQAYIFNSSEDCRLCRNSLAVHLLKIAGCLLSWWTWWKITNKPTYAFCCAGFLLWRRHCVACGFIPDTFRPFFFFQPSSGLRVLVLGHEVDGTYMLYEYNNCSGFSGSPGFNKQPALTFARSSSRIWSCAWWATASGWGPGWGGVGGGVYREIPIKGESGHSYQSALTCVFTTFWSSFTQT